MGNWYGLFRTQSFDNGSSFNTGSHRMDIVFDCIGTGSSNERTYSHLQSFKLKTLDYQRNFVDNILTAIQK